MHALDASCVLAHELRLGEQPLELGGERQRVTRLEQRAELAVAHELLVLGQPRHHGHGAARERPQHELRRRRGAARGGDGDRRARQVLRLGAVRGPGDRHAVADPARQRHRRTRGGIAQPDRRLPVGLDGQAPQRAQEEPQRAALLLAREHDARRLARRLGTLEQVGARMDDLVVAGEVALDQVARGDVARRAPVEAAEEQLDDLARDLRRDEALGGRVEGADVQRLRVAQRRRRSARRERLVHVHEVELGAVEQVLERARDVDRQRHGAAALEGQRLAHGDDRGAARLVEERVGIVAQRLHLRPALAHELARVGRRDHDDAMAARTQLVREVLDEAVDLVMLLPGPRGDLSDRERHARGGYELAAHPAEPDAPPEDGEAAHPAEPGAPPIRSRMR